MTDPERESLMSIITDLRKEIRDYELARDAEVIRALEKSKEFEELKKEFTEWANEQLENTKTNCNMKKHIAVDYRVRIKGRVFSDGIYKDGTVMSVVTPPAARTLPRYQVKLDRGDLVNVSADNIVKVLRWL